MTISTYCAVKNLGTKFNEVVIPPCVLPSCFYLDSDGVFTIEFNGYFYRSPNYEFLVEFVKERAAKLSVFDVAGLILDELIENIGIVQEDPSQLEAFLKMYCLRKS